MSFEWCIETHDTVSSTQDMLKEKAQAGAAGEGFVLQAMEQDAGHGRHGRGWVSPPGNLYLSMVLKPSCSPRDLGQLSLLTAVALAQSIESSLHGLSAQSSKSEMDHTLKACDDDERVEVQPTLKWPNDLLIDGRKCAGLLLETSLRDGRVQWVVIGVGVNIASAPADIGACLNDFSAAPIDVNAFRDAFLRCFRAQYEEWSAHGFEKAASLWLDYAHAKGTALSVKIAEQLEKGYFHDIDAHGNLRIRKDDGTIKTIGAGDVYLYDA